MAMPTAFDPKELEAKVKGMYRSVAENPLDLKEGETVLDLGSGSGMDTFIAALKVGQAAR